MKNVHLAVIDMQISFCDPNRGELYVPGAEKDCERVAKLIDRIGDKLTDITVTLDSHYPIHIAHACWWKGRDGNHPKPFTMITVDDVENGTWRATKPSLQGWALKYVKTLAKNNRFQLVIWPQHCIIGSENHALQPVLFESLKRWSEKCFGWAQHVTKGSNILTEHYGAVEADVPIPDDTSTQLNIQFVETLQNADMVLFTGEASNFCVKNTLMQVVNNFSDIKLAQKIKVLKDCMSPVPGFDSAEQQLWDFCKQHNIEVLNSTDVL